MDYSVTYIQVLQLTLSEKLEAATKVLVGVRVDEEELLASSPIPSEDIAKDGLAFSKVVFAIVLPSLKWDVQIVFCTLGEPAGEESAGAVPIGVCDVPVMGSDAGQVQRRELRMQSPGGALMGAKVDVLYRTTSFTQRQIQKPGALYKRIEGHKKPKKFDFCLDGGYLFSLKNKRPSHLVYLGGCTISQSEKNKQRHSFTIEWGGGLKQKFWTKGENEVRAWLSQIERASSGFPPLHTFLSTDSPALSVVVPDSPASSRLRKDVNSPRISAPNSASSSPSAQPTPPSTPKLIVTQPPFEQAKGAARPTSSSSSSSRKEEVPPAKSHTTTNSVSSSSSTQAAPEARKSDGDRTKEVSGKDDETDKGLKKMNRFASKFMKKLQSFTKLPGIPEKPKEDAEEPEEPITAPLVVEGTRGEAQEKKSKREKQHKKDKKHSHKEHKKEGSKAKEKSITGVTEASLNTQPSTGKEKENVLSSDKAITDVTVEGRERDKGAGDKANEQVKNQPVADMEEGEEQGAKEEGEEENEEEEEEEEEGEEEEDEEEEEEEATAEESEVLDEEDELDARIRAMHKKNRTTRGGMLCIDEDDDQRKLFKGAGSASGVQIWRIENLQAVPYTPAIAGAFSQEDAYLLLKTEGSGVDKMVWDIYYWLGAMSQVDKAASVAIRAVQLNDFLGGQCVHHREVQAHESEEFLSVFNYQISYTAVGAPSVVRHVDKGTKPPKLARIHGSKLIQTNLVETTFSSLRPRDSYVLEVGPLLYIFNGPRASPRHRSKALEIAVRWNSEDNRGRGKIIQLGDPGIDVTQFCEVLSCSKEALETLQQQVPHDVSITEEEAPELWLYEVTEVEGQVKVHPLDTSPPFKRDLLDSKHCYVLDSGNEVYAWSGRQSPFQCRRSAYMLAEEVLGMFARPAWTPILRVMEGAETILFKEKFVDWIDKVLLRVPFQTAFTSANAEESHVNVEVLLNTQRIPEPDIVIEANSDCLEVWKIGTDSKGLPIADEDIGLFDTTESYLLLYSYREKDSKALKGIAYFWQGRKAKPKTYISYRIELYGVIVQRMEEEGGHAPEQVRVYEGKEGEQFCRILNERNIVATLSKEPFPHLYHIKQRYSAAVTAIQIEKASAKDLSSNSCFVLHVPNTLTVWVGKGSSGAEQKHAMRLAKELTARGGAGCTLTRIEEGQEPSSFWESLGGRQPYADVYYLKDSKARVTTRFFVCSRASGSVEVEEIQFFTQTDLHHVVILDAQYEIFVWHDPSTRFFIERDIALKLAAEYAEKSFGHEPHQRPIKASVVEVQAGKEPLNFTCHFQAWSFSNQDPVDAYEHQIAAKKQGNGSAGPVSSLLDQEERTRRLSMSGSSAPVFSPSPRAAGSVPSSPVAKPAPVSPAFPRTHVHTVVFQRARSNTAPNVASIISSLGFLSSDPAASSEAPPVSVIQSASTASARIAGHSSLASSSPRSSSPLASSLNSSKVISEVASDSSSSVSSSLPPSESTSQPPAEEVPVHPLTTPRSKSESEGEKDATPITLNSARRRFSNTGILTPSPCLEAQSAFSALSVSAPPGTFNPEARRNSVPASTSRPSTPSPAQEPSAEVTANASPFLGRRSSLPGNVAHLIPPLRLRDIRLHTVSPASSPTGSPAADSPLASSPTATTPVPENTA